MQVDGHFRGPSLWLLQLRCVFYLHMRCSLIHNHQITQRAVNNQLIWKHLLHSGVTHYCGAPTVQVGPVVKNTDIFFQLNFFLDRYSQRPLS